VADPAIWFPEQFNGHTQEEKAMKRFAFAGMLALVAATCAVLHAESQWQAVPPAPEHAWLKQMIGEWESEAEFSGLPGEAPVKSKGHESVRAVGELWIVSENETTMPDGVEVAGRMTLGFNPNKKKYVGNWIDSATPHMWVYEGTTDAKTNTLTLTTFGPSMMTQGAIAKFRDVIEFKTPDHRVLTSSTQKADGTWAVFMTANYHRKK